MAGSSPCRCQGAAQRPRQGWPRDYGELDMPRRIGQRCAVADGTDLDSEAPALPMKAAAPAGAPVADRASHGQPSLRVSHAPGEQRRCGRAWSGAAGDKPRPRAGDARDVSPPSSAVAGGVPLRSLSFLHRLKRRPMRGPALRPSHCVASRPLQPSEFPAGIIDPCPPRALPAINWKPRLPRRSPQFSSVTLHALRADRHHTREGNSNEGDQQ